MPTFNERKSDPGYYIRAHPPELGNITYQIEPEANAIVEDYGFKSGEEISWEVIQSLKAIRCISTEQSGIIEPDDEFKPDPEILKEASLSDQEAESLLTTIQEHHDLTQEELDMIGLILGIETPNLDIDSIRDSIEASLTALVGQNDFPISTTAENINRNDLSTEVFAQSSQEYGSLTLFAVMSTFKHPPRVLDGPMILGSPPPNTDCLVPGGDGFSHNIIISIESGITDWVVCLGDADSWSTRSEIMRQIGLMTPIIVEKLENSDIDPGTPKNLPDPVLKSING